MPITLYQHSSTFAAGALKASTNSVLSAELEFKSDLNYKFYPTQTIFASQSAKPFNFKILSGIIDTYSIGLSSSTSSTLTSINITPTVRVTVNKFTGVVSLSSQTPGTYRFNYFAKTSAFGLLSSVTLSAVVPVVFLSSAPVMTPTWSLPYMLTITQGNKVTELKSGNLFTLSFRKSAFTEFDKTIAMYNTRWGEYSLVLSREFEEPTYTWKYILKNRAYEL